MLDTRGLDVAGREVLLDYLSTKAQDEMIIEASRPGGPVVVSVWCPQDLVFHLADLGDDVAIRIGDAPSQDGSSKTPKGLSWVHKQIKKYLAYRWTQFHLQLVASSHHRAASSAAENAADDVSTTLFEFLTQEVGVPSLVERYASSLLDGIVAYRDSDLLTQLFGVLLHSREYTTVDIRAFLSWHNALSKYCITHVYEGTPHDFLKLRDVPYLLRLLLLSPTDPDAIVDASASKFNENRPLIPPTPSKGTWVRCRGALVTWCDDRGRVPGPRPATCFIPPFTDSPYAGHRKGTARGEGRFKEFSSSVLVHAVQVLSLVLVNWKAEQTGCIELH